MKGRERRDLRGERRLLKDKCEIERPNFIPYTPPRNQNSLTLRKRGKWQEGITEGFNKGDDVYRDSRAVKGLTDKR